MMHPNRNRDLVNVVLSVGQSKIGAGAIDRLGNQVCRLAEIASPRENSARIAATARRIAAVVRSVGLHNIARVGVSFPEMMPPPCRLVSHPDKLRDSDYSIRDAIAEQVARELGSPLTVEVLHDAAAAVLGEVSPHGTLPGCSDCVFIVWGTGVASGIIRDGGLYWRDPAVGVMTGEIGLQVIRLPDGSFEYRPSARLPALAASELRMDRWLRGPEIAKRFAHRIRSDARGRTLLHRAGTTLNELDLVDVNRAARRGDQLAIELIASAGIEMGRALVPFVHYWLVARGMEFARSIVIGSGVAKLGDGIGVLIAAIRNALGHNLPSLGVGDYDPTGVILSAIGYEREFYAFIPT
jgi:predicted NBD/HSP70 family sugar kinase